MKDSFEVDYGCNISIKSLPHVTLVNFVQNEASEQHIVNRLRRIFTGFNPFNIELNGFGGFDSHTVFVNVETKGPIRKIVKRLRASMKRALTFDEAHEPHFVDMPHLTIARGMTTDQHNKAMADWKDKEFTSNFDTNEVVLLRRPLGRFGYKEVAKIPLTGENTEGEQLALF